MPRCFGDGNGMAVGHGCHLKLPAVEVVRLMGLKTKAKESMGVKGGKGRGNLEGMGE